MKLNDADCSSLVRREKLAVLRNNQRLSEGIGLK